MTETFDLALRQNVEAYGNLLAGLLERDSGKFVILASGKLVDVYDTYEDALTAAYTKFGRDPFFVQRVAPLEERNDFNLACRS